MVYNKSCNSRGRKSSALALSPRGRVPLDSHLLGVIGVWNFGSCLAGTPRKDDRPPTHFFVKKKFIPAGDAERLERVVLPANFVRHRKYPTRRGELFSLQKKLTA